MQHGYTPANYVQGDFIQGDKVGRDSHVISGSNNTVSIGGTATAADVTDAVRELREVIADLTRAGHVTVQGAVVNPDAVVQQVRARRGRLPQLTAAIGNGGKEAVLAMARSGIAALVVGLLDH